MSERFKITSEDGLKIRLVGQHVPGSESILGVAPAPDVSWGSQAVPSLEKLSGYAFGLGGGIMSLSWTVSRQHASALAAWLFRRDHLGDLPQLGVSVLEWELNGSLSNSSGCLTGAKWGECYGVRTTLTYTWTGSLFVPASLAGA